MEALLLVADIAAMFVVVWWSARSDSRAPERGAHEASRRSPATHPEGK